MSPKAPPMLSPALPSSILLPARPRSAVGGASDRANGNAASAASCRSTARARSKSPASTSMSAARTRSRRAMPAGASPSAQGFKALWAKMHKRPISEAPNLSDSTLDGLVSSIIVEREQIGPNRYIADLGILFDRARAGELLGVGGEVRRSAPMLLIPVTSHRRHRDQRRAAQSVAARLGPVPHVAKPDRLCPGQRHGGRSAAGQRRADQAARAAAGGATSSTFTAPPTSWSPRSSCTALYPGGPA